MLSVVEDDGCESRCNGASGRTSSRGVLLTIPEYRTVSLPYNKHGPSFAADLKIVCRIACIAASRVLSRGQAKS